MRRRLSTCLCPCRRAFTWGLAEALMLEKQWIEVLRLAECLVMNTLAAASSAAVGASLPAVMAACCACADAWVYLQKVQQLQNILSRDMYYNAAEWL